MDFWTNYKTQNSSRILILNFWVKKNPIEFCQYLTSKTKYLTIFETKITKPMNFQTIKPINNDAHKVEKLTIFSPFCHVYLSMRRFSMGKCLAFH